MKKNIILIPALNEEKNIKNIILKFKKFGKIVVIDDGSKDNTYKLAKEVADIVIKNDKNLGYDQSLKKGIRFIIKKFPNSFSILTADADNQHKEEYIPIFQKLIKKYDVLVGCRNFYNRKIEEKISSHCFAHYKIKDPLTGFKCYKMTMLKKNMRFIKNNFNYYGMFFLVWLKDTNIKNINIIVNKRKNTSRMNKINNINREFFKSYISIINSINAI
tara:strand:- start:94 stop:744 length:651 start_codon:yes stop_codon:yes gene_type:complete